MTIPNVLELRAFAELDFNDCYLIISGVRPSLSDID
jgi:hypothetical protein